MPCLAFPSQAKALMQGRTLNLELSDQGSNSIIGAHSFQQPHYDCPFLVCIARELPWFPSCFCLGFLSVPPNKLLSV